MHGWQGDFRLRLPHEVYNRRNVPISADATEIQYPVSASNKRGIRTEK